MPYNPAIHNRHSIRLPGYDYTRAGSYYVTISTHKKDHLFAEVVGGVVKLSPVGEIVQEPWLQIPTHFSNVVLDAFVILPNLMHGIVVIMIDGRQLADHPGLGTRTAQTQWVCPVFRLPSPVSRPPSPIPSRLCVPPCLCFPPLT